MKKNTLYIILIGVNLLLIALFIVQYTSASYPLIGHDFRLYIPRLIDSHLFYKVNGFAIEWYTPSFGGGLPAYPNPLQMQFSLPQLFTLFFNPWVAILISIVIFTCIGFLVMFFLLRDSLEYKSLPAILGALFFVGNGFFIEHIVVGHVNFITFPLIVIPVFALIRPKLPAWLAGSLIAFTGMIMINSGGVYIAIICVFTLLLTLPVIYFLKPGLLEWRRLLPVIIWGTVLTFLLCGSKLYAISALMNTFPREMHDRYFVDWFTSIWGMIVQLIGTMTAVPLLRLIGKNSLNLVVRLTKWTGSPYGFWELDSSLSPVLILLLIWGAVQALVHKPKMDRITLLNKVIAGSILVFFIIVVVQFSTARGFFFEHLRELPLLRSTRTNSRFTAAFILPLILLGIQILNKLTSRLTFRNNTLLFIFLDAIALLSLGAYYLLPISVQSRFFDTQNLLSTYKKIQAGARFPVNKIIPTMNDYEVFQAQASNTSSHYDPLYGGSDFLPLVHEGSVFDITGGYYNLTDPTGYVFPSENGTTLFSRIPVSDYGKLENFINRRQVDWKLPWIQVWLDWLAGITVIVEVGVIMIFLFGKRTSIKLLQRAYHSIS